MEQYLPQCLDSICREDVPQTLEAIIVNDGSTDRSLEIAKEYQQKRPDIINIIDKPNGHYGSCVNAALKVATGKYFRPLDADDWFDTNALIDFLKKIEHLDVDLLITPRSECFNNETKTYSLNFNPLQIQPIEVFQKKEYRQINGILSMHSMTYSRATLKKTNLELTEGVCYTDTEYYMLPLFYCQNFTYIDSILYQYRLDREGQSMDPDIFLKNRHQLIVVLNNILKKIKITPNTHIFNKFKDLLVPYLGYTLFQCKKNKTDTEDIQNLYKNIQNNCPLLWKKLNRELHYFLSLWRIFGGNFYLYTRVKRFFGIKNLFFQN